MSADAPTEIDVLEAHARDVLSRVRTLIPAEIVKYANSLADVQITRRGRDREGRPYQIPPITNCVCQWPRFGGLSIVGEYQPKDEILLGITDRSLDAWLQTGGIVDGSFDHMFSLSDAIVMFGTISSVPKRETLPAVPGHFTISRDDGTAYLRISLPPAGPPVVEIDAETIKLGAAAAEAIIKGDTFKGFFDGHTHSAGGLMDSTPAAVTGATGPPVAGIPASSLSTKAKTE